MAAGQKKDDAPADLALVGAALRVEHEIAAYTTARNLAVQLRQPDVAELLTMSLGEEQNAGPLLDVVAPPLMSVAKMPPSSDPDAPVRYGRVPQHGSPICAKNSIAGKFAGGSNIHFKRHAAKFYWCP